MSRPSSTLKFAGLLMLGAVVGKAFGFVREILFAKSLGATAAADSFRGAMTAVLTPLAPLQGDLVPSTLVPLFLEWRAEGRSSRMTSSICMIFALFATTLAVLISLFTERYVDVLVGGFSPSAKAMTVSFARVMVLAMPASVLIASFSCVEIGLGRSRMTSMRASVQNVSVLAGIAVMSWTGAVIAIAWAFAAGLVLVALYGLVTLWREGEISPFDARIGSGVEAVTVFFRRAKPLLLQPGADLCNTLLERLLASALAVGTMASLDYARTITETVYYAVSQPIGYVVLGQDTDVDLHERVRLICRPILSLSLPASVFLITFATDITTLVFGRGAFEAQAIATTSVSMRGIGVGLWATTIGWILVRMLNAQRRNGAAARALVCAYTANMAVNLVTFRWLGPFGLGLGEAARGLVLLIGTAQALGCAGLMARMVARVAPVTLALAAAGLILRPAFETPPGRLLAGASLYCAVLLPWLLLSEPRLAAWIARRTRGPTTMTAWLRRRFPSWRSLKLEAFIEVGASPLEPLASLVLPGGRTPPAGTERDRAGRKAS